MIKNYFYKQNGVQQDEKEQREIAVSAVLQIINSAAVNSGAVVSLTAIQRTVSDAADAIQEALSKEK